jgi:hypothetical protein
MYTYSRAPTTFYRVEDADSCARRIEGVGIVARRQLRVDKYTWNHDATVDLVLNHLDWRSQKLSPFMSAFDDLERTQCEARRREDRGHRDVVIWEIDTTRRWKKGRRGRKNVVPRAEYRNLTNYAETHEFKIPKVALNMSECEWLFLNEIPECMIVRAW